MWSSAAVLDCLPHRRRASALLVTLGLAGAAPAALAGWVDWAELHQRQARTGVVHAAANSAAVGLYSLSLWKRLRGRPNAGRALAFAGLGAATLGGAIGGHLSYRQAAGVNHTEAVPYLLDSGWQRIGAAADFPAGELRRVPLGEVPLLVVRQQGGQLRVLADRCSHLSGPLSEGSLDRDCVRCPWHGSTFRLDDGSVATGPATAPQPVFEVREEDGDVLVRPPRKD
jgi:nitrite reductase/ring-hydroxylating ferredoxin subunit